MHGSTHSHILTHTNDLGPRSVIQVSSVYPTYTHIKDQCPVCVFYVCVCVFVCMIVCVCSQASRSRATLSCDSSYCHYNPICCHGHQSSDLAKFQTHSSSHVVLVTCKYEMDLIKNSREKVATRFPIISL